MEDASLTSGKHKKGKKKIPAWITATVILVTVLVLFILYFENSLKPAVLALSEAKLKTLATEQMNDSVLELTSKITYTDLVNITYDKEGKVAMLQANTVVMSRLSAQIANSAQEKIAELQMQGIGIPLGNIIGGQLFAGLGPKITVNIIPAGSVKAEFASEFESSGINQTRHRIFIVLTAIVNIVVPGASQKVEVVVEVPISETIIIGNVPQNYIFVDEREKMYNLLPTG
ncbi:MAG: sporulation protein YunB [Christensenellales bacterium]